MSSFLAGVKALVSVASAPKKFVESIEAPSPALQETLNQSLHNATMETMTICFTVCKAVLAEWMGVPPSSDEVNAFMSKAANDPRFAHRAYRLFGEAQKSSDRRRRVFLAAMLFALPFEKMPDDERDRVDMVVERLVPEDVLLLVELSERNRTAPPGDPTRAPPVFLGTQLSALINGVDVRIATTADYHYSSKHGPGFDDRVFVEKEFSVDQLSFGTLVSLGCIDVGQSSSIHGAWQVHRLIITELGRLVIRAIEEVRSGFATTSP